MAKEPISYEYLGKKLRRKFGAKVKSSDAPEYSFFEGLAETFSDLRDPAITVGKYIYMPESLKKDEYHYFLVLCHELAHVLQWKRNRSDFFKNYFLKKEKRTKMEVEAFKSQMEAEMLTRNKVYTTPGKVLRMLSGYGVRRIDLFIAKITLNKHYRHVKDGRVATPIGKELRDILSN